MIGINGFGRTGRQLLRAACELNLSVVQINDPNMDLEDVLYLMKYDSVYGRFPYPIDVHDDRLLINGKEIVVTFEPTPDKVNWNMGGALIVCDCSGKYLTRDTLAGHLKTAKKVLIAAPPKDDIPLFVVGVNDHLLESSMDIVSNSSCNTNCLAVMCYVLEKEFGIEQGLMTTIHAVTGTQLTVDGPCKKDRRRGRASAYNIVPSTTGSAKSVGKVLPQLEGKMNGIAFRVPTIDVCVVDLTVKLSKHTSIDEVVEKMKQYEREGLLNILRVTEDEIVSSDLIGDPFSCVLDVKACIQLNNTFMKFVAWTDNEYAYSCRMLDMVKKLSLYL